MILSLLVALIAPLFLRHDLHLTLPRTILIRKDFQHPEFQF